MKNLILHTILVAGLLFAPAFAQRVEIYGGAQYEHLQPSYNAVGWNASLTGNFKHVLGITADFSGVYKSARTSSFCKNAYAFWMVISALRGGGTPKIERAATLVTL